MNDTARTLVELCRLFGERQWCLATGGNFSARLDGNRCLITRSGCDKSRLVDADLIVCTLEGEALDTNHRPSAETALHTRLYGLDPGIGAVLHTHSVNSTVLSRRAGDLLELGGFEMQKALGNTTHDENIELTVFDNDQDIDALAQRLADHWQRQPPAQPGFLVRGHGLYAWGGDLDEARRNAEGFEFLFACLVQERLLAL